MGETIEAARAAGDVASRWLSRAAIILVAMAAVMGWGASFVGLHAYGMQSMSGFTYWSAWLLPATFDGAAFACTLLTYRSSINGRSALRGRLLMWGFTAVSSWINWIHQPSHQAQIVAAGLPIAAVAVFDIVLIELRADFETRHGRRGFRLRPGLLVLRWMVDRDGTKDAFRRQVIDIPVEEIAGLGPLPKLADSDDTPASPATGAARDTAALTGAAREGREGVTARSPEQAWTGSAQANGAQANGVHDNRARANGTPHNGSQLPARHALTGRFAPATQRDAEASERAGADTVRIRIRATDFDTAGADAAREDAEHAEDTDQQAPGMRPAPGGPLSDVEKRAAARRDYRAALEAGETITGAMLGTRYGYSERWGRHQVAAARDEMRHESHPRLVAVDRQQS